MKTTTIGFIILITGLLITLYTGFNYITKGKLLSIDNVRVTNVKEHTAFGSPFFGITMVAIGGIIFLSGKRKDF